VAGGKRGEMYCALSRICHSTTFHSWYSAMYYCLQQTLVEVLFSLFASAKPAVPTQKWHDSRYVRLKARSANLVLILDILLVWLGDAFYRSGGSSWIFRM
jgi:hypothetical protein